MLPFFLKYFFNRVSGSKGNMGKIPVPIRSIVEEPHRGRHSPATKSKYRPVYQIPLSLHLLPRSYLLGSAFPKPCYYALTGEKMKGVIPYHETKNLPHT